MSDLNSAVFFTAIDRLSNTLSAMGERVLNFGKNAQETRKHISDLSERLVSFGERTALTAALISESASKLLGWSEALQEPVHDMQKSMATMAATTGFAGDQLEEIKHRAMEFAAVHLDFTTEEWVAGFTRLRGIFQDTGRAMHAEGIVSILRRFGVDSSAATRLLRLALANLHTDAAATGDKLTATIQAFGFAHEAMNQVAMTARPVGAEAPAANAFFSELLALNGEAQHLLSGGCGAMIFSSLIQGLEDANGKGKIALNSSHELVAALVQLRPQLTRTPTQNLDALAAMGLRGQLLRQLGHLDEVATKQQQMATHSGALSNTYATARANMADATQRRHQDWANVADALSGSALGIEATTIKVLTGAVAGLSTQIEHHSKLAGLAATALTGIGSAAYRGVQAIKYGVGLPAFESLALPFTYATEAVTGIVNATNLWTAAQWLLTASLSRTVLTIGGIMVVAAVLRRAAYSIYRAWNSVAAFFEKLWGKIRRTFASAVPWMENGGERMMKALGKGILSAVEWPVKAAQTLASKMGGVFHFHSSPAYGLLREVMLHFNLGRELARRTQPAGVVSAAARLVATAAPESAGVRGTLVIHYSPNITINSASVAAQDWVKAARDHGRELMRVIDEQMRRRARLNFA